MRCVTKEEDAEDGEEDGDEEGEDTDDEKDDELQKMEHDDDEQGLLPNTGHCCSTFPDER
eukprot:8396112-Pyramimonas_sp.AAC.1